ncbi:hypothetical protein [Nonomuraea sp. SBT364]|uniref:hypothetical protein n=1 Tax=Nonomuraea sp. SBT364 TaxID=1580530 RepID=UPI00066D5E91|nr:hypothetical protein [Nonomuraea sp. SBT364]
MRNIKLVLTGAALGTVLGGFVVAGPALADERTCRGTIGAVSVDGVYVPKGATCKLSGTRVEGDVKVAGNATLVAKKVKIDGNVQAEGARSVSVTSRSVVDGDIQVKDGGATTVTSSRVNGNIQLEDNRRRQRVEGTRVDGDIQVKDNRGGVRIYRNKVDGNLQCEDNGPRPTGGRNAVAGDKEGQCRRL